MTILVRRAAGNRDTPASLPGGVRRMASWLCLTAIVAVAADCYLVEGLIAPGQIVSGSMAPSMLGPHFLVTCGDCGYRFRCDAENVSAGQAVVCPNCFYEDNQVRAETRRPGERFLVERATYALRRPRRWAAVVFRCPSDAKTYCVKRIVGLPGETVQLDRGDVYINGNIARKTIAQQHEMAILVHDNRWASRLADLPPRWKTESAGSMWRPDGAGFRYRSVAAGQRAGRVTNQPKATERVDYLSYHHWRTRPGRPNRPEHVPITDDYAYNPNTSRRLHDMTDLMLVCRAWIEGSGSVWFRAMAGRQVWEAELAMGAEGLATRWTLFCNGKPIDDQELRPSALAMNRWRTITWSVIDRQIILAIDGQAVAGHLIEASNATPQPTATPLAIGFLSHGTSTTVEIQDIRVLRDVYYTVPQRSASGRDGGQSVRLPSDGYFVLGDNSPISDDSRSWTFGPVLRGSQIVGRPVSLPW